MSKPTILFINRVYPPVRGATGRVLSDLANEFARKGWQVSVISSAVQPSDDIDNGVRVIRVKGAERHSGIFSYLLVWIRIMIKAIRLERHDLVVSMSDPPLIIVAGHFVAKYKKSRHINWCQDLYPDVLPALGVELPIFMMRWLKKHRVKAMKKCDRIIVCGNCMAKRLAKDGILAKNIKVISNWPDMELIDMGASNKNDASFKKPDDKTIRPFDKQIKAKKRFRVLYSGNIGLAHPVKTILDAAELLDKQDSDIEFVFVGDGARFDYIAEQRDQMALDNVRLLPYQPASNIREMMESGDVHLITMSDSAVGMIVPCKIYSAMAVARPCVFIGPPSSEVANIISEYESGFIVAQGDSEALVKALSHFRDEGDAWFDAHQGAVKAREVFTPRASMDKWLDNARDVIKVMPY